LSLALVSQTVRADGLAIRGTVKGTDGKSLAGAEVRVQRLDGKGPVAVATTNAKGEYSFKGLSLAPYKVTTVVNKVPKQVASVNTRADAWVRVDFNLNAAAKNASHKHQVWVAGETGTHIGGGHWESVDDTNTGHGASSMERVDGSIVNTPNSTAVFGSAGSGPSH
jgi:hypothetical protein